MTDPFAAPASPSAGIDFKTVLGDLLLITVHSLEAHVPTVHTKPGEQTAAIRADVIILDGANRGDEYIDTLIFPLVLISQLRSRVGQKVLARLGQGEAKAGKNAPWLLTEATEADKKIGVAYLAGQLADAAPPF